MTYKKAEVENFQQLRFLDSLLKGHNGFIAGGCFKDLLTGSKKPKDYDIFFESRKDYNDALRFFDEEDKWKLTYFNDKARAYRNTDNNLTVEIIKTVFGTPQEVLEKFDFTVAKFAYISEEYEDEGEIFREAILLHHEDYFEHLFMKRLVIDGTVESLTRPLSTFERSYKYKGYGFGLCRESKVKLAKAIQDVGTITDDLISKSFYDGID